MHLLLRLREAVVALVVWEREGRPHEFADRRGDAATSQRPRDRAEPAEPSQHRAVDPAGLEVGLAVLLLRHAYAPARKVSRRKTILLSVVRKTGASRSRCSTPSITTR